RAPRAARREPARYRGCDPGGTPSPSPTTPPRTPPPPSPAHPAPPAGGTEDHAASTAAPRSSATATARTRWRMRTAPGSSRRRHAAPATGPAPPAPRRRTGWPAAATGTGPAARAPRRASPRPWSADGEPVLQPVAEVADLLGADRVAHRAPMPIELEPETFKHRARVLAGGGRHHRILAAVSHEHRLPQCRARQVVGRLGRHRQVGGQRHEPRERLVAAQAGRQRDGPALRET